MRSGLKDEQAALVSAVARWAGERRFPDAVRAAEDAGHLTRLQSWGDLADLRHELAELALDGVRRTPRIDLGDDGDGLRESIRADLERVRGQVRTTGVPPWRRRDC